MKALILAGGRGTRLWPLSRQYKPKQFQKLISQKTMFQETVARLLPLFNYQDIIVSTFSEYLEEVKKEVPKIPKKNIIIEHFYRERLPSLLLFLTTLKKEEFKEPLLVLPSDHLIKNKIEFQKILTVGEKFIRKNPNYILMLGEKPTFPDTGLGYIKKGNLLKNINNTKIYTAASFKEKPNLWRTRRYLKTGNYFWNTAIYIFTPHILEALTKQFVPDNFKRYEKIKGAKKKGQAVFNKVLEKEYPKMDAVSLEYSIIENYQKTALISTDIGWSDIGSWNVLKNVLSLPDQSYVKGNYIGIDSKNIMVYGASKQLVAGVGIKNLIAVVTDDIILLCHKDKAHKVKEITKRLEEQNKNNHLL